jgi:hypothetical protein
MNIISFKHTTQIPNCGLFTELWLWLQSVILNDPHVVEPRITEGRT